MRAILVTSAGGAPALGFVRSLRDAPESFRTIGIDANKFTLQRSETDERHLVPRADDPMYADVLRDVIAETGAELLHCQMSSEMLAISRLRDQLGIRTFMPAHATIETCEDKFRSYQVWNAAHLPVPATRLLRDPADLERAFRDLGPRLWLRAIRGSAGRGSLPTEDLAAARRWVDEHRGWGSFTAARCLGPETVTWLSIWNDGELVVAQGRRRLYWEFSNRAPSGVTGVTGAGVTFADRNLDRLAEQAVRAIDSHPRGIFGVDLTYSADGEPHLTEINVGRFFTTHQFFTAAGLNLPYIYVKLGLGESPSLPERRLNPLESGWVWIRGMDREPVLVKQQQIDATERDLARRLEKFEGVS